MKTNLEKIESSTIILKSIDGNSSIELYFKNDGKLYKNDGKTEIEFGSGNSTFAYNLVYTGNDDIYMSFVTNVSLETFNNISSIAKSYICANGVDFVELTAEILPIAITKDTLVVFRIEYSAGSQNAILNITGTNN